MSWWDTIQTFRSGKAVPKKAASVITSVGGLILFPFLISLVQDFSKPEIFRSIMKELRPLDLAWVAVGLLFITSGAGILKRRQWGKRLGQSSIVLFMLLMVLDFAYTGVLSPLSSIPADQDFLGQFRTFTIIGHLLEIMLFGLLAYFGIRYLGRLPAEESSSILSPPSFKSVSYSPLVPDGIGSAPCEESFHDSIFPFGISMTMIVLLFIFFLMVEISIKLRGDPFEAFPSVILICFVLPISYNYIPSPFQQGHKVITSTTGGGSIGLLHGSIPFFRSLIYEDGLEIRAFFHRYFIPYDQMQNLPKKIGFFNFGLPIRSDLPGVPSVIRLQVFGRKIFLEILHQQRDRFLSAKSS